MEKYKSLLEGLTLLKPISTEVISQLIKVGLAKITEYKKDTVVHLEGDLCSKLDIILKGNVAMERIDSCGNVLAIAEFSDDDILGGNLLFSQNPNYQMTTITRDNSVLLELDKDALFTLLSNNKEFLLTYLEFISDNALILGDKIRREIKKPIRDCIIGFLKTESKNQQSRYIKLDITKKALAEKIGVQRTSLSRELARMKKNGLILFDTKSITILDRQI